jgi:DNA-binding NarL/FixJ family response regulator
MMGAANRIRILIVDDHEVVREGLKALLQPERDLEVVAETGLGSEVPDLATRTRPDVVLLDARLPDVSGPEICRNLSESHPQIRVIILTAYTDDDLVEACIRAGAKGYLVKDVERFWLKQSIRAVSRGEAALSPQVAGKVLDRVRDELVPTGARQTLNRTQLAILRLIARGYSNREIASEVHLSENTVKTHVQSIFGKLGAHNRVEAAMLASRRNLI